jgi:hypothetical protein
VKEAALPLAYCLSVSNLRDTGHSTHPTLTAALAEQPPYRQRRLSVLDKTDAMANFRKPKQKARADNGAGLLLLRISELKFRTQT